jgi:hypothetical protein
MPILGILASAITGNLVTNSYESIATVTVGSGGSANVEFTSIPATYTHLQVRCFARTNRATYNVDAMHMQFNSDATGTNYTQHNIRATSPNFPGTVSADGGADVFSDFIIGANNGAAPFAGFVIDVLDYTNTNKYTTVRGFGGADTNGDVSTYCGVPMLNSQLWKNTNAVTSIKFVPVFGTLFDQYSQFALYGIRGA